MPNQGRILGCDTDRSRLSRLSPRAARAGATIIETMLLDPGKEAEALAATKDSADVVLIDAPCSGTGTWRRNPEARWRLTPERLERLIALQARLLEIGSGLVRPGGHMVRSEEHTSEIQSLMSISYAVFCLKKKISIQQ